MATAFPHTPDELARFRQVQRLAYDCVEAVAAQLVPGMTEREAVRRMADWLALRGVRHYFHLPFAWFGDRTAFEGFWTPVHFFPTHRRLERDMPIILDVAPILDGYAADVGYSCMLGETSLHSRMLADLEAYRVLILDGVRKEKTLGAIYREVDELIAAQGHRNRHRQYPFGVLAHRVDRLRTAWWQRIHPGRFGVAAIEFLARGARAARRGRAERSPLWNEHSHADQRAAPGLWAVEPHIGCGGVGVKWEELLVVTDSDACWLDDDLPHVRRWRLRKAG